MGKITRDVEEYYKDSQCKICGIIHEDFESKEKHLMEHKPDEIWACDHLAFYDK